MQAWCSVVGNQLLPDSANSPFSLTLGKAKVIPAIRVKEIRLGSAICRKEAKNLVIALRAGIIPANTDQQVGKVVLHF
jgi:hypothetical protein